MATTVSNTTLLFLVVSIVLCLVRWRHGGDSARTWAADLVVRGARSKLLLGLLFLGAAVGIASHVAVGYLGPGDLFQDFVGAKEVLAGRSINPSTEMRQRVKDWLDQEPWQPASLAAWPALERMRADAIANGAGQLVVQAHPPFHILLITPLVALCGTAQKTFLAMTLLNLIGYGVLLLLVWRIARQLGGSAGLPGSGAWLLLLALALDWQPFLANLRQGQIGIVVALLVTAGWYLLSRNQPWAAGVAIGVAALIKMYPVLLLVWLVFRNRRAFAAAVATALAGCLVLFLMRGSGAFVDYYHAARTVEHYFGRARINYSLSSVLPYVLAGGPIESVWTSAAAYAAEAVLLGYSVFLTLQNRNRSEMNLALEFSGYVLLAVLLSPTAEAFYYPLFLLPIALIAMRTSSIGSCVVLLAALLFLSFPDQVIWKSTELLQPVLGNRAGWLLSSYPTIAMLALWYRVTRRDDVRGAVPRPILNTV